MDIRSRRSLPYKSDPTSRRESYVRRTIASTEFLPVHDGKVSDDSAILRIWNWRQVFPVEHPRDENGTLPFHPPQGHERPRSAVLEHVGIPEDEERVVLGRLSADARLRNRVTKLVRDRAAEVEDPPILRPGGIELR